MTYEMCQILSNSNNDKDFELILELLFSSINDKINEYTSEPSFNNLIII